MKKFFLVSLCTFNIFFLQSASNEQPITAQPSAKKTKESNLKLPLLIAAKQKSNTSSTFNEKCPKCMRSGSCACPCFFAVWAGLVTCCEICPGAFCCSCCTCC